MIPIVGRFRALFVVAAGALLLAGCGSGPSQAGAAVILGDRVVPVDEVQGLIDNAVRRQPLAQQLAQNHKLDLLGREIVHQLVIHDLLARVAPREGLVVNEGQIAKALEHDPLAAPLPIDGSVPPEQAAEQIVVRARDHREAITDTILQQQLALKYLAKLSITFDFSVVSAETAGTHPVPIREKAIEKAKQFAASPGAAAQLIAQEQQSGGRANIGQQIPAAQSPVDAATVLFGAAANTVTAFQPSPTDATWVVVVIRVRSIGVPIAVDQTAQPTPEQLTAIGQRFLQPDFAALPLRINPRYGVWDLVDMNVAPSEATTKGVVLPVRGAAQPQP